MHLPIYHHPSLTVLIDDSDSFLKSLAFQLDPALASKAFHDTRAAIDWLQAHGERAPGDLHPSYDTYPSSHDECSVAFDIDAIHRISFERQRFLTPSVIVVDYSMPQMNGVQLCEALRALPCKKILFTGVADEKVAVEAFNRGLIDRYIKKSGDDALDRLESEIATLQDEYFAERSGLLRDMLAVNQYSFVSDPAFTALVRGVLREHAIVEHYIYSSPPGILMYDSEGCAQLMVVETEAGMEAHYEVACDSDAPPSLLEALRARCIIPWFRGGDGMFSHDCAQGWHKYVAPAHVHEGAQKYYWALFRLDGSELTEPATSFSQFLRERAVSAA